MEAMASKSALRWVVITSRVRGGGGWLAVIAVIAVLMAGMGLLVHLLEARGVQVGVNLGGGQVGMAQKHLQDPQIGPPGQQVGGKGMPQGMGAQGLHPCLEGILLQELPETLAGEPAAPAVDEDIRALPALAGAGAAPWSR